jgi:hypothetical protein
MATSSSQGVTLSLATSAASRVPTTILVHILSFVDASLWHGYDAIVGVNSDWLHAAQLVPNLIVHMHHRMLPQQSIDGKNKSKDTDDSLLEWNGPVVRILRKYPKLVHLECHIDDITMDAMYNLDARNMRGFGIHGISHDYSFDNLSHILWRLIESLDKLNTNTSMDSSDSSNGSTTSDATTLSLPPSSPVFLNLKWLTESGERPLIIDEILATLGLGRRAISGSMTEAAVMLQPSTINTKLLSRVFVLNGGYPTRQLPYPSTAPQPPPPTRVTHGCYSMICQDCSSVYPDCRRRECVVRYTGSQFGSACSGDCGRTQLCDKCFRRCSRCNMITAESAYCSQCASKSCPTCHLLFCNTCYSTSKCHQCAPPDSHSAM